LPPFIQGFLNAPNDVGGEGPIKLGRVINYLDFEIGVGMPRDLFSGDTPHPLTNFFVLEVDEIGQGIGKTHWISPFF
jgi:hypothetical protein